MFNPLLNNAAATLSMKPIADFVAAPGQVAVNSEVTEEASFLDAFNTYISESIRYLRSPFTNKQLLLAPNKELVGLGAAVASRLIPAGNFEPANQQELVTAIMNGMAAVGDNFLEPASGLGASLLVGSPERALTSNLQFMEALPPKFWSRPPTFSRTPQPAL